MEEESALALEADPIVVTEAEASEEGQDDTPPAEVETEETKKTEAAKRRERDKAHRARLQADRDAAVERARSAEESRDALLRAAQSKAPPNENDYPDPFEFGAAKALWRDRHEQAEGEAKKAGEVATAAQREAQEISQREQAAIDASWAAQRLEAEAKYADFAQVALSSDVTLSDAMVGLIKTSDVGADVAYHLGQNRDLAASIAKLSAVEAARAIGRIEASLTHPKPRTQSTAPPPISPVKGAAGASRDPAKMSPDEYRTWRAAGGKI